MGLAGIDKNWIVDFLIGIAIGIGLIIINSIIPVTMIGIPSAVTTLGIPLSVLVAAGVLGRFVIICVIAPIVEELTFRDFILDYFDEKLVNFPYILAVGLSSALFSFFHYMAYGQSLVAAGGTLFSAFLFGFLMCYVRRWTKSNISNIVIHGIFNFWIISAPFVVFGF